MVNGSIWLIQFHQRPPGKRKHILRGKNESISRQIGKITASSLPTDTQALAGMVSKFLVTYEKRLGP